IETTKDELSVAKSELKEFLKSNKLSSKEDHSEDPKHGKKYRKYKDLIAKKEQQIQDAKDWIRDNKPAVIRPTKYEYPEDCVTEKDKKKFRARMRAEAKRAEAGEQPKEKKAKTAKKDKAESKKSNKKEKTEKKPKVTEFDAEEDED